MQPMGKFKQKIPNILTQTYMLILVPLVAPPKRLQVLEEA